MNVSSTLTILFKGKKKEINTRVNLKNTRFALYSQIIRILIEK